MLSTYQSELRDRLLAAPVAPAPAPWTAVSENRTPIGGLQGIGFGIHPDAGHDLVMVVSTAGHGLFDAVTGEKIARDRDPDPETSTPDDARDLACPGLGPLKGTRVRIAGLFGGGLHSTSGDGWSFDVVSPQWPHERVLLSDDGGALRGEPGKTGGTSSTPTTPRCARQASPRQVAPSPSPRAATSPCGRGRTPPDSATHDLKRPQCTRLRTTVQTAAETDSPVGADPDH